MTEADHRRVAEILAFATNLEHAGDVVDKGLLGIIAKQVKRGLVFSPAEAETFVRISRSADRRICVRPRPCWSTGENAPPACWSEEKEKFRAARSRGHGGPFRPPA